MTVKPMIIATIKMTMPIPIKTSSIIFNQAN
jgi:hypothetical protein